MTNVMMSHIKTESVSLEDMSKSVCVASFIFDSHVREVWMPLVWGGCLCVAKDVLSMTGNDVNHILFLFVISFLDNNFDHV